MNYSELTEVKPYPAYKTSQIPWIGEIPEHWEVSHLRYFCECLETRTETPILPKSSFS